MRDLSVENFGNFFSKMIIVYTFRRQEMRFTIYKTGAMLAG